MCVDWQRECFSSRGVTRTVEGPANGLQLTTHREKEKYPWIAKARAGTESPSTKLLRAQRNRIISCSFRAVETGKHWMICLLRAAHRLPSGRCFILGRALGLDMLRHESPVCSRPSFDQRLRIVHERVRQRIAAYVADRQGLTLPGPNETTNYKLPIPFKSTPRPTIKARKRDRERAERILSAGGPKPSLRERAVALVRERGTVRTRDLTDIGIPRCYLPGWVTRACSSRSATVSIAPQIRRRHNATLQSLGEWQSLQRGEIGDVAMRSMPAR